MTSLFALVTLVTMYCGCQTGSGPDNGNDLPNGGRRTDFAPKWCPVDSTKIGYTHSAKDWQELQEFGQSSIWIVDLTTQETRYVTEGVLQDWAPDGDRILFHRYDQGVFLGNLQTGAEEQIPVFGEPMDFSPSGREIAFVSFMDPEGIYILNLETLTSAWIAQRYDCDWSPDGERILCDSLIIISSGGARLTKIPLGPGPGIAAHARWSPNGREIAFGGFCDDSRKDPGIWVVNLDGSGLRVVACRGAGPSWSRDGRMLAYSATSAEGYDSAIWIISIDGTGKRQVSHP